MSHFCTSFNLAFKRVECFKGHAAITYCSYFCSKRCTGCGRNNSHILKVNKNQKKQGTQKILLFIKSTYDAICFSNTFKDNIAQVPAVIDDIFLKLTEDVHGFARSSRAEWR